MGLDMYLNKKTYVQNWEHTPREKEYDITIKRKVGHHIKTERITEISEEIMYWRKANHIHKFFVDNCAAGYDNCQEVYVSRDTLVDLVAKLKIVLHHKDEETSAQHLPTTEGFFFGMVDYGDYYYECCSETLETISNFLKNEPDGELYYQASW